MGFPAEVKASVGISPSIKADTTFGHAPSGMQITRTTIWDRANATPTQQVMVLPTEARIHNIASTDNVNDKAGGTGALTVRVYGLTSWDQRTHETSELVTLNGTTAVATTNSYVIVHRMRVESCGSSGWNTGTLTATAVTDATVSQQVQIGMGSSQSCFLGVPRGWRSMVYQWYVQVDKSSGSAQSAAFSMEDWEMSDPANPVVNVRDQQGVQSTGSSSHTRDYKFPLRFTGPCVVHVSAIASAADLDGDSSFTHMLCGGI